MNWNCGHSVLVTQKPWPGVYSKQTDYYVFVIWQLKYVKSKKEKLFKVNP